LANTVFKLRRSSVAGKVPNTTTLSIGELGLNLTDRKLFSSDGSAVFELGSNLTSLSVFSTLYVGNSTVNVTINSTAFSGSSNNASYLGGTAASGYQTTAGLSANVATLTANNSTYFAGQSQSYYANVTSPIFTTTITVGNSTVNTIVNSTSLTVTSIIANGSVGSSTQVLASNGTGIYWTAPTATSSRVYSKTVASALQNTFTTSTSFTSGAIDVYVNGVHLSNTDFTEVNNTTVQLTANCTAGQIVELAGYGPQSVLNPVTLTSALNNFTGTGAQTVFGLTTSNVTTNTAYVFINGVLQNPSNAYSISANIITFTTAPSNQQTWLAIMLFNLAILHILFQTL
jgi:hypothetical protein